jgi:acyl dehydratase
MSAQVEIPFHSMGTISREQLKAYAQASGDHNPIHLDDKAAQAIGLTGVIAHGMLIAGLINERALRFITETAGHKWWVSRSQTRFRAMTLPGDEVQIGGTVKSQSDQEWSLELQAKNQKGEVTTITGLTLTRLI